MAWVRAHSQQHRGSTARTANEGVCVHSQDMHPRTNLRKSCVGMSGWTIKTMDGECMPNMRKELKQQMWKRPLTTANCSWASIERTTAIVRAATRNSQAAKRARALPQVETQLTAPKAYPISCEKVSTWGARDSGALCGECCLPNEDAAAERKWQR